MQGKTVGKVLIVIAALVVTLATIGPTLVIAAVELVFPRPDLRPTAEHQVTFAEYQRVFQPGATRKEVEDFLRSRNTTFIQSCCGVQGAFSTMVRIGERPKPWFCSGWSIYVVFEFSSIELDRRSLPPASDDDILTATRLTGQGDSCL